MLFSGCSTARRYAPILLPTLLVSLGQISVLSRLALFFPHFRVEGRNYAETQRASAPPRDGTASKTAKRTRTGGTSAAGLSISKWDALWPLLQPPLNFAFPESLDFPSDLRPYQIDGVRFLADNDNALLADDMGTGKTVQTTAALRILAQKGKVRSALVVCPLAVLSSWERHILEWGRVLTCVVVRATRTKGSFSGKDPDRRSKVSENFLKESCVSTRAPETCLSTPSRNVSKAPRDSRVRTSNRSSIRARVSSFTCAIAATMPLELASKFVVRPLEKACCRESSLRFMLLIPDATALLIWSVAP